MTFTFSEDPGSTFAWDGTSGDVLVNGGTLSSISGSGLTRTATFTPTAGIDSSTASITVAQGSYTDTAGNDGGAGITPSLTFDTQASTLTVSGVSLSGDTGTSSSDLITKTAAQTISGTLSAALTSGDVLEGSLDGGTNWMDITTKVSGTT
ncbi:MAG: Ig-like domain-containing protein [Cyanobacteria bacterium]|nr:Ig-like domain-containing protein [Cyanobacteriota bacterium]